MFTDKTSVSVIEFHPVNISLVIVFGQKFLSELIICYDVFRDKVNLNFRLIDINSHWERW